MKKAFFSTILFLGINLFSSQIGVNTDTPQATFDIVLPSNYIKGSKAGITIPQLSGNQIEAINTIGIRSGTLVYSTGASSEVIKDVTSEGYWYWKNPIDKWEPLLVNAPKFFYSPSVPINTSLSISSIDLYSNYKNQFTAPMASSTGSTGSIPIFAADQLEYYVTWYDNTIFNNVIIDSNGVLTYSTLSTADTSKPTYMNVVFVVKQ
jgi:hypothetical protein